MTVVYAPHAPAVDPRVIALAHYAGRGVLEAVLARHGAGFQEQVTLRPVALADGPVERDDLIRQLTDALKVPAAEIGGTIDGLVEKGLLAVERGGALGITDAGRSLCETTGAETQPISARIYAGIPAEDLAVAGRVLTLITERANAELDSLRTTHS
ncbi:MarR family transcriptional regulator [Streptomyces sp. NPDC004610]|uniref:MarR family transcriptional regulator n=1 Tax=unclassified Streptomyces TaxID=2593676 RepID=UPI0033AABFBC